MATSSIPAASKSKASSSSFKKIAQKGKKLVEGTKRALGKKSKVTDEIVPVEEYTDDRANKLARNEAAWLARLREDEEPSSDEEVEEVREAVPPTSLAVATLEIDDANMDEVDKDLDEDIIVRNTDNESLRGAKRPLNPMGATLERDGDLSVPSNQDAEGRRGADRRDMPFEMVFAANDQSDAAEVHRMIFGTGNHGDAEDESEGESDDRSEVWQALSKHRLTKLSMVTEEGVNSEAAKASVEESIVEARARIANSKEHVAFKVSKWIMADDEPKTEHELRVHLTEVEELRAKILGQLEPFERRKEAGGNGFKPTKNFGRTGVEIEADEENFDESDAEDDDEILRVTTVADADNPIAQNNAIEIPRGSMRLNDGRIYMTSGHILSIAPSMLVHGTIMGDHSFLVAPTGAVKLADGTTLHEGPTKASSADETETEKEVSNSQKHMMATEPRRFSTTFPREVNFATQPKDQVPKTKTPFKRKSGAATDAENSPSKRARSSCKDRIPLQDTRDASRSVGNSGDYEAAPADCEGSLVQRRRKRNAGHACASMASPAKRPRVSATDEDIIVGNITRKKSREFTVYEDGASNGPGRPSPKRQRLFKTSPTEEQSSQSAYKPEAPMLPTKAAPLKQSATAKKPNIPSSSSSSNLFKIQGLRNMGQFKRNPIAKGNRRKGKENV